MQGYLKKRGGESRGKGQGFDHEQHMEKIARGLTEILNSDDLEQIKAIAASLLKEEEREESIEEEGEDYTKEGIGKQMMDAMK